MPLEAMDFVRTIKNIRLVIFPDTFKGPKKRPYAKLFIVIHLVRPRLDDGAIFSKGFCAVSLLDNLLHILSVTFHFRSASFSRAETLYLAAIL